MKTLILTLAFSLMNFCSYGLDQNWKDIESKDWFNFAMWKAELYQKEKGTFIPEKKKRELLGRVMSCVGECLLTRGEGEHHLSFRSPVYEGDEISTLKNSTSWVFLLDGTIVRLSPETSISFKEINLTKKEVFFYSKVNYGHISWISREDTIFKKIGSRETDTAFLPLRPYWMNLWRNDNHILPFLEKSPVSLQERKYEKLNKLHQDNNQFFKGKKSYSFVAFPNGSVFGENLHIDLISLLGHESYMKKRSRRDKSKIKNVMFFFRGFENKREEPLDDDKWLEVGPRGRELSILGSYEALSMSEFITKHIPSIYTLRELMLRKYSENIYHDSKASREYSFWDNLSNESGDLAKRLNFIKEYSRRSETTGLAMINRLNRKDNRYVKKKDLFSFYSFSMNHYFSFYETALMDDFNGSLNSEKQYLWKKFKKLKWNRKNIFSY